MTNRYLEITDLTDDDHFVMDTKTNKKISYEDSIKLMNKLSDENEQLKQKMKRILQNEYDKCDIPVWKHQYVKSLAEKLGVELE